jgi:cobalamin biosynthetic protein CobC
MRDHGGNLDQAIARFGGAKTDWIDLSTGINRRPYPVPPLPPEVWTALPRQDARQALIAAAAHAYRTDAAILPLAGAQAAIQLIPRLDPPGRARVLSPTYNEHAAALRAAGWTVDEVTAPGDLVGADLAVLVNPNNPDGRAIAAADLRALAAKVERLVVDESFADIAPDLSIAPDCADIPGLLVLRSFGKFYGLAGLRLGFAIGAKAVVAQLAAMAGPWAVSGPALEIGALALRDDNWAAATRSRLAAESPRIDALAQAAGWRPIGGTALFRLYDMPEAAEAQARLAHHRIWSRIFPGRAGWLRLGLPGDEDEWTRLSGAMEKVGNAIHP